MLQHRCARGTVQLSATPLSRSKRSALEFCKRTSCCPGHGALSKPLDMCICAMLIAHTRCQCHRSSRTEKYTLGRLVATGWRRWYDQYVASEREVPSEREEKANVNGYKERPLFTVLSFLGQAGTRRLSRIQRDRRRDGHQIVICLLPVTSSPLSLGLVLQTSLIDAK